jgi:hypothetical protein
MSVKVVDTYKKSQSQEFSRSPLEIFVNARCHEAPGQKILYSEFYDKFIESLDEGDRFDWSKQRVTKSLPSDTPSGSSGGKSQKYIGNLSWDPPKDKDAAPFICVKSRLKLKEKKS